MKNTEINMNFISRITDFIFVSDLPRRADAIFLPGGPHPETAEYAAELYHRGLAPLIIPSGKYGMKLGKFAGVWSKADIYSSDYQTECEFFTDVLLRNGVPRDAILGEDRSMHTRDNAFLSRELIEKREISIRSGMIICKSFHARRCQMLYQMAFPQTEILVCPIDSYGITRENWFTTSYGIDRVLGEMSRCGSTFIAADMKRYLDCEEEGK